MQMLKKNPGNVVLNVVVALGLVGVIVLNALKSKERENRVILSLAVVVLVCNLVCMKSKNPMLKGLCVVVSLVLLNIAVNKVYAVKQEEGVDDVKLEMGRSHLTLIVAVLQAVMCVSACCAN